MVSVIQRDPAGEQVRRGGVLVRGDEIEPLVDARVEADYDESGLYHRAVRARVRTAKGEELVDRRRGHGLHPAAQPARGPRDAHRRGHDRAGGSATAWATGSRSSCAR